MFVIGIHNKLLCDQNFSQCHVWKPTCMQRAVQSSSDKIIYPVVSHLQPQFKNELFHIYFTVKITLTPNQRFIDSMLNK